jgi:hypothetical protein
VIVKAANIVLTPDKPEYKGGAWHIEGMPYENIVATGIYYSDCQNIQNSKLEFRRALGTPFRYEQNDREYVKTHYGIENYQELNEHIGSLDTIKDRCITFPNFVQHRVTDFELIDKSKIGERKILVFFLINPLIRIKSTRNVPLQQGKMTLDEAKQYRLDLMYQRKYFINHLNQEVYQRTVSLCEH